MKLILEAKGRVDILNNEDETPLFYAVAGNHPAVVRALLTAKANVNHMNCRKETPMHWAVQDQHLEVIKVLKVSHSYHSMFVWVVFSFLFFSFLTWCKEFGARDDIADEDGVTAAMIAETVKQTSSTTATNTPVKENVSTQQKTQTATAQPAKDNTKKVLFSLKFI